MSQFSVAAPIAALPVRQLGDPLLRRIALPVADIIDGDFLLAKAQLKATLAAFRLQHGFGRAIAAPQVGIDQRMIALDLGQGPFVIINPEIVWRSPETFTLWDDCMSFPSLLVRLRRHDSITVRYLDELGRPKHWERLDRATAELLQHEIDHLDGILAVDHALDREALISREAFAADPDYFRSQVDYLIGA